MVPITCVRSHSRSSCACAVNVVIMQAVGAGVHVSTTEYCDDVNDGERTATAMG